MAHCPFCRAHGGEARLIELRKLLIGAAIVLPLASVILTAMQPQIFRYLVSSMALILLALLILGVRYRGVLRNWMLYGAGALGGFLGGVAGTPGPPVIMIYMASTSPPAVIRANNMLYLFLFDVGFLLLFAFRGLLDWTPIILGLFVALPYLIGSLIGQRIFNPERESLYRNIAYLVIAISAIQGLPFWDSVLNNLFGEG